MTEVSAIESLANATAVGVGGLDDIVLLLEEGDGPDRDLDLAVFNLWNEQPYRWSGIHEITSGLRDIAVLDIPADLEPDFARFCVERDENSIVVVPRYTESQDAGARLATQILPGRRRLTLNFEDGVGGFVQVGWRPEGSAVPAWIWTEAHAQSAARAQVAAILRAYAQKPALRSKES
ncbi:conserved hypothetical protein [Hyphomicrobiales bacterium]|jgi:hypothetical protein|nr:conserved hypothetical protein [Hyphomicrobiales bacterium]CAH1702494.1 hypothetical protein BOSEA1005_30366 [Hyphomicrobiales bacterium]CAI0346695.1 conserved hypothetical protein [Hyphomicrobiales bacterium]